MIQFNVPSVPVGQPRPRAVNFGNRARIHPVDSIKTADGRRKPHPIVLFRSTVQLAAQDAYQGPPLDGPLIVSLVFVLPRPKGMFWKKKDMPRVPHTGKPDCDNLTKAVFDSLNKVVWQDDSQVAELRVQKWIANGEEQPHVYVSIQEFNLPF